MILFQVLMVRMFLRSSPDAIQSFQTWFKGRQIEFLTNLKSADHRIFHYATWTSDY